VAVTAAVVSWNTRELLLRCLRSLEPEVAAKRLDVWVVDNASSDGSAEAARSSAPWARVLESRRNLGFGGAVNLVASRTAGDWLLAANADIALEPGALAALLAAAEDGRVGCVAPRLILPDGTTQHSVHPFPTLRFTAAFNAGLHRIAPDVGDRLCLEGHWDPERSREVPWAIGACLLLRRQALDDAGGFDDRQWMYAEDLDLGWRLRDRGWITRYEPSARVLHESGPATRVMFGGRRASVFMAATYAVLARRRGRRMAALIAGLNVAGAVARLAWIAPLACVARRWRGPAAENWGWLRAHLAGLRAGGVDRLAPRA
jgi:N-acetylglucosaminyl-diphospho-decaprenol L-rhamnosyltransferase